MSDWQRCMPEPVEDIVDRFGRLQTHDARKLFRYLVRFGLQTSRHGTKIVTEELMREINRHKK